MKAFSFICFIQTLTFSFVALGQQDLYLQVNGSFLSFNKYNYDNSDILTGKGNAFKPNFGHPQLVVGFKISPQSAFESGIIYRINTFNFEGNAKDVNDLISLDLSNSVGLPLRYRYYFNDFIFPKDKIRFSANIGFIALFQSNVDLVNQSRQVENRPYIVTLLPYTVKKNVFLGEFGLGLEKRLLDKLTLSFDYNFWLGNQDYAKIDLIFKNYINGLTSKGSITHTGTNHNLSIGIRYTFTN